MFWMRESRQLKSCTATTFAKSYLPNFPKVFVEGPHVWRPRNSGKLLISPDCVFDASLVPGTCPGRFLDLKGLINKFLESRLTGQLGRDRCDLFFLGGIVGI